MLLGGTGGGFMAVVQPGWALCIDSAFSAFKSNTYILIYADIAHVIVSFSFTSYGLFTPNPKLYVLDVFRSSQCHVFQFKCEI